MDTITEIENKIIVFLLYAANIEENIIKINILKSNVIAMASKTERVEEIYKLDIKPSSDIIEIILNLFLNK